MTSALTTAELTLSKALRMKTAEAHERAEHSVFMQDLLEGRLHMEAFRRLQEQSWFVYRALESAARAVADDPLAARIVDPKLERLAALEADLDHMSGGTAWRTTIDMLPETRMYVERLEAIEKLRDAVRLIAHHYVRYLGDLSGGQIIGRMMQRHYGADDESTRFFRFADIPKTKPYKDSYRAALDGLPLRQKDRERLLNEASEAFICNVTMFAGLGR